MPTAGQQPQVGAVRRAPAARRTGGDCGVRGRHPVGEVAVGRQPAGRELAAPPLHAHRVVAQPRVGGARLGDGLLQRRAGVLDRLVEGHAEPALGDQQVRHGRRPVAGLHPADRERVGQRPARHQRVDVAVAAGLQPPQRGQQGHQLLDGADTVGTPGGVRRPARHREPEGESPGVGRHQVETGRLRHHAGVRRPAAAQRRVRAETAVLLAGHAREQHVAAQRHARPAQRRDRGQGGDQAGLHVARPAAVQLAVDDPAGERVRSRPGRRVTHRHDVDVAVEHQRGAVPGAGQAADEPPRLVPVHLDAGEVGRGQQLLERQPPVVGLQPGRGEVGREQRLDLVLRVGAADARYGDQRGEPGLGGVSGSVDLVEHPRCPVGHGASLRRANSDGAPSDWRDAPPRLVGQWPRIRPCRGCG